MLCNGRVVPVGKERTNVAAYVRAHLLYTGVPKDASTQWRSETVLCKNPEEGLADYFWDARFAFEYDAGSVTFIRYVFPVQSPSYLV